MIEEAGLNVFFIHKQDLHLFEVLLLRRFFCILFSSYFGSAFLVGEHGERRKKTERCRKPAMKRRHSFLPRLQDDVMKYGEVGGRIQLRRSWAHMGKCISGRESVFFYFFWVLVTFFFSFFFFPFLFWFFF